MQLRYLITSCVRAAFSVTAEVAGRSVEALVQGLVIEGTSEDGSMGHTFRLSDVPDLAAAEAEFAVGNVLTIDLAGTAPA